MKHIYWVAGLTAGIGLFAASTFGDEEKLTTLQAKDHIGQTNTVCGTVASARQVTTIKGAPTFLDFDKPHPDKVFVVVIWDRNLSKFKEPPEKAYAGKRLCVTGLIEMHKGTPEIEVRDPSQISVEADAEPAAPPPPAEVPSDPKQ